MRMVREHQTGTVEYMNVSVFRNTEWGTKTANFQS